VDDRLKQLLDLAFRVELAAQANTAIAEVREAEGSGAEPARSYELILGADATFDAFAQAALPRLVYHFESVRARPPSFGNTVISVFAGDRLLFIRAAEFLPAVARLLATTVDDLYARYGTGEQRTAVRDQPGPPLALPSKPSKP
jgi:hypothetical protein